MPIQAFQQIENPNGTHRIPYVRFDGFEYFIGDLENPETEVAIRRDETRDRWFREANWQAFADQVSLTRVLRENAKDGRLYSRGKGTIYSVHFERTNWGVIPPLNEHVYVILQTETPFEDTTLEQFDAECWRALAEQYPLWICPYHQGNRPPSRFENIRHSFSSPWMRETKELLEVG